jgi:hypothetical protein
VAQKEDFGQLELLFDVDFESDMEKLKQELGIVSQPKRQDLLEEYGLHGFIEQLTNVVASYGKQWASSLIDGLNKSELGTVLSEIEHQHPPLFAQLIAWGLGGEGLCPETPF